MNNVIAMVVALLVIIGGGIYFLSGQTDKSAEQASGSSAQAGIDQATQTAEEEAEVMMKKEGEDAMMKKEEGAMEKHDGDSMEKMEKSEDVMEKEDVMMKKEGEDAMMKKDDVMEKEDVMQKETTEEEPVLQAPGVFKAYSSEAVASADGDIVIGFFADWCPSCRALKSDLGANASSIPSNLTILDANYDSATDLKKKYGVTTQHTLVQVDKNGTLVKTWRGGNTLDSVVSRIN